MNTPATHAPTLRPYRIRAAGLEYIAMASSAGAAVIDAIALHGVSGASATPFASRLATGGRA